MMVADDVTRFVKQKCLPEFTILEDKKFNFIVERNSEGVLLKLYCNTNELTFDIHINIKECIVDVYVTSKKYNIFDKPYENFIKQIRDTKAEKPLSNFPTLDRKSLFKLDRQSYRQKCGGYLVQRCRAYNLSMSFVLADW